MIRGRDVDTNATSGGIVHLPKRLRKSADAVLLREPFSEASSGKITAQRELSPIHTLGPVGTDSEAVARSITENIVLHSSFEDAMSSAYKTGAHALVPCGYIDKSSLTEDNWATLNFRYADKMTIVHCLVRQTKPMCIAVRCDISRARTAIIYPATLWFLKQWDPSISIEYATSKPLAVELTAAGKYDACIGSVDVVNNYRELRVVKVFGPQMVWCIYERRQMDPQAA